MSLSRGNNPHCNNEMNVALPRVSFSFCALQALPLKPVCLAGITWLRTHKTIRCWNMLYKHVGRKNVLLFICNRELFCNNNNRIISNGTRCKKCFITYKNTDGKSSNNIVVGFSCFVFFCRQTENLKLSFCGTPATHTDTKRGN